MKHLTILLVLVFAALSFSLAQDKKADPQKSPKNVKKAMVMQLKDHVCTDACKEGKHVFKHGEKGHVCTSECKQAEMNKQKKGPMSLKEHTCTSACTEGNHSYLHGEKGHVCTEACKAM